jgi:hypothetical protein
MHAAALQVTAQAKRQANAKARAALRGIVVHVSRDEKGSVEYIATRWALTKAFSGASALDELEAWLDRVGAPA